MAIYDKEGNQLFVAYDKNGDILPYAYDKNGTMVYAYQTDLKVMTYNVRWFSEYNSQVDMQKIIIGGNDPDIIGFQEFSTSGNEVMNEVLADYPFKRQATSYDCPAIASKVTPISSEVVAFQSQPSSGSGDHSRYYIKGFYEVNGKTVCFLCTHLVYKNDTDTRQVKYDQMEELFDFAQTQEYVIICGDFNMYATSENGDDYVNMYDQFINAEYKLANNTQRRGWHPTFYNNRAEPPTGSVYIDNIIVSSNIDIVDVQIDLTKLDPVWLNADSHGLDHVPIIATLKLN